MMRVRQRMRGRYGACVCAAMLPPDKMAPQRMRDALCRACKEIAAPILCTITRRYRAEAAPRR